MIGFIRGLRGEIQKKKRHTRNGSDFRALSATKRRETEGSVFRKC